MGSPSSPRIKKHSRSRTGCFTCRKRRIKCDEQKPMCGRCDKGGRDCSYPPPLQETLQDQMNIDGEPASQPENANAVSSTESSPDFDLSDHDTGYSWNQATVVKFGSGSGRESLTPEALSELTQQPFTQSYNASPLIPSGPLPDLRDPLSSPQSPTISSYATSITFRNDGSRTQSPRFSAAYPETHISPETQCIPRPLSPRPNEPHFIQYYLAFHRECINQYHYFIYSDYGKLCTQLLFAMAEQSNALRHAMVAFSTLIYSINKEPSALHYTFVHYEKAVQELRYVLVKDPSQMDRAESETAVATALLLTTWERFFGDTPKSFRHLKGAHRIFVTTSTPAQTSSTTVGRSLLEWYIWNEDVCCLVGAYRTMLPMAWREESVRVRTQLTQAAIQHSPERDRRDRLLDDAYAQFHLLGPQINDVVHRISQLKSLSAEEVAVAKPEIEKDLQKFDRDLIEYTQSPFLQDLFQPISPGQPLPNHHSSCCPPSPFPPHRFQYPQAAYLQLSWLSYQCFTRFHLYKALRPDEEIRSPEGEDADYYGVELCRTFAGIVEDMGDIPACDIPCASALLLAALCLSNPGQTRQHWLRFKLGHLEKSGLIAVRRVKVALAAKWNMADIVTEGFYPKASPPLLMKLQNINDEDVLKEMESVDLKRGSGSRPGSSHDSLRGILEMRGVFNLQ